MSVHDDATFTLPMSLPMERRLQVALFVCPGFFLPDNIGLQTVFGMLPNVDLHLVWTWSGACTGTRSPGSASWRWSMRRSRPTEREAPSSPGQR